MTKIRQIMDKELGFVDNITSSNSVPVDQKVLLIFFCMHLSFTDLFVHK